MVDYTFETGDPLHISLDNGDIEVRLIEPLDRNKSVFKVDVIDGDELIGGASENGWVVRLSKRLEIEAFKSELEDLDPSQYGSIIISKINTAFTEYGLCGINIPRMFFSKPKILSSSIDRIYSDIELYILTPLINGRNLIDDIVNKEEKDTYSLVLTRTFGRYLRISLQQQRRYLRDVFGYDQHLLVEEGITLIDVDPTFCPSLKDIELSNTDGTAQAKYYNFARLPSYNFSRTLLKLADKIPSSNEQDLMLQESRDWYSIHYKIQNSNFDISGELKSLENLDSKFKTVTASS